MEYNCPSCKERIVKDIKGYLKKYPDENWMMCPHCRYHILIKTILEEIKK